MIRLKRDGETLAALNSELVWKSSDDELADSLNEATQVLLPVKPQDGDPGLYVANQLVARLELPATVEDSRKKIPRKVF